MPVSLAFFMIACPKGCSDPLSAIAASFKTSRSGPEKETISVTLGSPFVNVPVLSNIMAVILRAFSRYSPLLIKIPFCAPLPAPIIMADGVAIPKAQGHAIINTKIKIVKARENSMPQMKYQAAKAKMAINITAGTKYAETTSAIRSEEHTSELQSQFHL